MKQHDNLPPDLQDWVDRNPHVKSISTFWEGFFIGVLLVLGVGGLCLMLVVGEC